MKTLHEKNLRIIRELLHKKLKKENILVAILGGSVARGDETEYSDIDIVFYVDRKNLPKDSRCFYKFKGKYIEEHYSPIEELKNENILPEEKILLDKTGEITKFLFNKSLAKKKFNLEIKEAKRYQRLAEESFNKKDYEESFYYLYGLGSSAFIIMHTLPPRFNLPFPSFRLLKSIAIIDKINKTKAYKKIEQIYTFKNKNKKEILRTFEKAYSLMNKLKKIENPKSKNLGFFDKTKIRYNLKGLKKTFEDYPFVYAYRFIVGCLTMWAFDKKIKDKDTKKIYKYLLESLGVKEINRELVKEKINISRDLIEECEKIK